MLPSLGFYNGLQCQTSPDSANESFRIHFAAADPQYPQKRLLRCDDDEVMTASVTQGCALDSDGACA
jgi:hypothetical protein